MNDIVIGDTVQVGLRIGTVHEIAKRFGIDGFTVKFTGQYYTEWTPSVGLRHAAVCGTCKRHMTDMDYRAHTELCRI